MNLLRAIAERNGGVEYVPNVPIHDPFMEVAGREPVVDPPRDATPPVARVESNETTNVVQPRPSAISVERNVFFVERSKQTPVSEPMIRSVETSDVSPNEIDERVVHHRSEEVRTVVHHDHQSAEVPSQPEQPSVQETIVSAITERIVEPSSPDVVSILETVTNTPETRSIEPPKPQVPKTEPVSKKRSVRIGRVNIVVKSQTPPAKAPETPPQRQRPTSRRSTQSQYRIGTFDGFEGR